MNKELSKIIYGSISELKSSDLSFRAIYEITFSRPRLIMAEDNDGFRIHRYTYGEIKERIEKTSYALYRLIGANHSYVGLAMENSVDWIVAFWSILKSGNKPYLVNLRHPDGLTEKIIKNLGITNIICDKEGSCDARYIPLSSLKEADGQTEEFENELAIASSGTSLNETICFYDGKSVCAQIFNTENIVKENKRIYAHYKGELKQLAFLPFYHVFGLFAVYFWFTFFKRTIVFMRDMAPDTILSTCRKHNVTHIFAVPLLWHTIEEKVLKAAEKQGREQKLKKGLKLCTALQNVFPFMGAALSRKIMHSVTDELFGRSVQFCISGGSFLRDSALALMNAIGYPLHNGYGMSEIGIASVELSKTPKERNRNSVGLPFASLQYKIDNNGVLFVKGDSICTSRLTAGKYTAGEEWFSTGDIAECGDDGRYYIKGRLSDTVIGENGENINPDIIERMFTVNGAESFSVLGMEDQLVMIVQVSEYITAQRVEQMREALEKINASLPLTQQIKRFYMTRDEIMAKGAIKVSRKYLALAVKEGRVSLSPLKKESVKESGESDSPLIKRVKSVVANVVGLSEDSIDIDANLLVDVGISSLQYFSVLSALGKEFGITAEKEEDCRYTVRKICEYIERQL